ncbi:MAG: hypothetical protein ACOC3G_03505, partial [Phycisphaeraceae bacterium]
MFRDGFHASALFAIDDPSQAPILDWVPQSLPYELVDEPDVLILGDAAAAHVWLALRRGAESVTVVHRDPAFVRLMRTELGDRGGRILFDERVRLVTLDPRNALSRLSSRFDLIHLADAEG